jgi:hypothetical protein
MGRTSAPLRISATLACMVALGISADPVSAQTLPALRAPQVRVNNGTLQGYLNGVGESINVETDQRDVQLLDAAVSNNSTFTLQFEFAGPPGNTLGIYNGHAVPGTLMPMFPTTATNGWFAVASWRTAPVRVVIFVFDASSALVGSTTFLGADRNAIGFYRATPHATYFTQDPLNPAGEPRALFFAGTGIDSGSLWMTWEDDDAPADFDFDDCVVYIEQGSGVLPVQRTTWGALKSRFR